MSFMLFQGVLQNYQVKNKDDNDGRCRVRVNLETFIIMISIAALSGHYSKNRGMFSP